MSNFDLKQLVRETLPEHDVDLDELTDLVYQATPRNQLREAYRQALRNVVRLELAHAPRSDQSPVEAQNGYVGSGSTSAGADHFPPETHERPVGTGGAPNIRNSRASLLRRSGFRERLHIGDGIYRCLEDCSISDLKYAAEERRELSAQNAAAAGRYERLMKRMEEHHVDRVGDLPIEVIVNEFGDEWPTTSREAR